MSAVKITKGAISLHNFVIAGRNNDMRNLYCPQNLIGQEIQGGIEPGEWRSGNFSNDLQDILNTGSSNYTRVAKIVRDDFHDYLNSIESSVPWQLRTVSSTKDLFDA